MGTRAKILLTVAVVAAGVGYMIVTTVSSGEALEYFKHVDEVAADPDRWRSRTVKLHGNVVAGTTVKRPGSLDFKFALHREGKWIDVRYHGVLPDAFKDCGEIVVRGTMGADNAFRGEAIEAKCPSKYDERRRTGCGERHTAAVLASRSR